MRLNRGAQPFLFSIFAILACGAFGGCSGGEFDSHRTSTTESKADGSIKTASNVSPKEPAAQKRAVVRKANLSVRTPNVESAEKQVTEMAARMGGFVVESASSNLDETAPEVKMKIRVPVDRFDAALTQIEGLGHRLHKSISGEDVTAQLVDYDARLKVMVAQESAFRNMLAKSSESASALDLQTRLMNLRSDIESMAAQKSALADLAALSTIELKLVGEAKGLGLTADKTWATESWNASTSALGSALRTVGSLGIFAVVFSPFWGPIAYLFVRAVRKKPVPTESSPPGYQL